MIAAAAVLCAALFCVQDAEPQGQEAQWVPFELYRGGFIFLEARVNGVEVPAVLDSGAGITCLDAGLARELGLEGGTPVGAEGVGGTVSAEMFQGVSFEVGDIVAENVAVIALDLSHVAQGLGRELPVILGRNFFADYVVDLDYPERRVAFRDPDGFTYDGPGFELELVGTASNLWAVVLEREGHPARLLVDTGSGGAIGIDAATAEAWGLFAEGVASTTTVSGGVGGMHTARLALLDELFVGDALLEGVPVRFSVEDEEPSGGEVGGIGSLLLSRFHVLFDTRRNRMILEPEGVGEPFAKNRVGLVVQPEPAGLRIAHVCSGSPAEASGLSVGDLVVSIDGKAVKQGWAEQHRWQGLPAGQAIVLLDSAGKRHELVAADFY